MPMPGTGPRPAALAGGSPLNRMTRRIAAPLVRLIFRPVIEGRERIPATGPVVFAANHLSFVDSIAIPLAAPRPVYFLAKAEYFEGHGLKGRLTRWFFTATGAIPVRRGMHRDAQAALDTALEVLRAGAGFGIYPEGTRSLDGRLYRGRTGVAWLALTTRAPVVPVGLVGTERIQPVGARLPRRSPVRVRFGEPLRFGPEYGDAGSAAARRRVTDEIMQAIGELSGQERAPGYNRPPQPE